MVLRRQRGRVGVRANVFPNGADHRSHGEQDAAIGGYVGGVISMQDRSVTSRWGRRSGALITYATLLDAALVRVS